MIIDYCESSKPETIEYIHTLRKAEKAMYLAWFDDSTKKKPQEKIAEAVSRYKEKFGRLPNVVLVHHEEVSEYPEIDIRPSPYVGHNNFWVGFDEKLVSSQSLRKAS